MRIVSIYSILFFLLLSCATTPKRGSDPQSSNEITFRYPTSYQDACSSIASEFFLESFLKKRERLISTFGLDVKRSRSELLTTIDALHLIDYYLTLPEIDELIKAETRFSDLNFPYKFNSGIKVVKQDGKIEFKNEFTLSRKQNPLLNFLETSDFLYNDQPEFNFETMKEVHSRLMKGGVDGLPDTALGEMRHQMVYGNEPRYIRHDWVESVNKNPYLTFDVVEERAVGKRGMIIYPNVERVKDEILERIKPAHPDLVNAIYEYRRGGVRTRDGETLTKNLVTALAEERLEWFVRMRNQIGDLDSKEKVETYIKLVADFYRDMVAIHPFRDGNGRTTRSFALYYPLVKEGIAPPRLIDPNIDVFLSKDEWYEQIFRGIESTSKLYDDLMMRATFDLPLENSPELLSPFILRKTTVFTKKAGEKEAKKTTLSDVDTKQYMSFLTQLFKVEPDLMRRLQEFPQETALNIEAKFDEFIKRNNLDFIHAEKGQKRVSLNFVDQDFMSMFGNESYNDVEKWRFKMDTWYHPDVVWRGLAYTKVEMDEHEAVSIFANFHSQLASNALLASRAPFGNDTEVKKMALRSMGHFNRDLYNGAFVKMMTDHQRAGELYGSSYGYSTSSNRTVAKAFGMGAMVVAPYGQQQKFQHLLKSRVVVGMYRGKKDIELNTLKQMRVDFSSKYPRQQEVVGIGAQDPDSVMVVQFLAADGKVERSYWRNPRKPSEIWLVTGNVDTFESITEKDIVKKIELP